ncbi:nucleoside/nucleotide kinase family protein [Halovulum sp. GXIMD14794]
MSDGLIIAVCGDSGAGKSTTTGLLRDAGFAPYSLSAFLRSEAEAAFDTPSRAQVQSHGKAQQERHGNHYYADVLLRETDLMQQRRAVIDGLRNLDELAHLRASASEHGLRLVLLALVLDTERRFQRVQGRARAGDPGELDRFRRDDARANGGDGIFQNNAELIASADMRIENTGGLDTLRANLQAVLEQAGAMPAGQAAP